MTIEICDDRDRVDTEVVRFLMQESAFLSAAARFASPTVWSVLTCRMWVSPAVPSALVFSPALLAQVAAARVDLTVVGYPSGPLILRP